MNKIMNTVSKAAMLLAAALMVLTSVFVLGPEKASAEDEPEYTFGRADIWSTADKEYLTDSFYYTDSWFSGDPEERNDSLALISMQLCAAAVDDEEDGTGAKFLGKLGFEDIHFENFTSEDPDDCAYTWAKKRAGGSTLIAVIVQSASFDDKIKAKGWKQNFTVNGDTAAGLHDGFSRAEKSVLDDICALSTGEGDDVKYWITGHSRGGALANLIACDIPGEVLHLYGTKPSVFAYTFEAPANTDNASDTPGYIHNYRAYDDIVTMVPPAAWGMGISGQQYDLKTEETDAKVDEELEKLGSSSRLPDDPSAGGELADTLIQKLVNDRIPDRRDYTKVNTEYFTLPDGHKVTVEYTPQETFTKLMDIIYGENDIPIEKLMKIINGDVFLDKYVRAYLTEMKKLSGTAEDSWILYYQAAEELCELLKPEEGELPFDTGDAYKILRIAAPVLIDADVADEYTVTDEMLPLDVAYAFIYPGMKIADGSDGLVFSHHFATSVARLKALAPSPSMSGINIKIPDPLTGDAVSKAPRDLESALSGLGYPWLDSSAEWETDDTSLKRNKTYYLDVTYYATGHNVPEDTGFTLNEKEPCEAPKITYKDGVALVRLTYQFDMGTPEPLTLRFYTDIGEVSEEETTVAEGTKLRYVKPPVMEDQPPYHFSGWVIPDGDEWDKVTAVKEISIKGVIDFNASWTEMISEVSLKFITPKVGGGWKMPEVPKNASYHIEEVRLNNEEGDEVQKVRRKREYSLVFTVAPNSGKRVFLEEDEEYAGSLTMSGAKDYDYYLSYDGKISVTVNFMPLDNSVTALQKGGSFKAADIVIRSSKSGKSLKGSSKSPLKLKAGRHTNKGIKLTWKKAKGAKKYVVYGAKYGKNKFRKLASVKKRSFLVKKAGGKLVRGKKYKFIVVAVDRKGNVVSTSRTAIAK